MFLVYEALKDVPTEKIDVETPLGTAHCLQVKNQIAIFPILRAGIGMMDSIINMVPSVRVGFIGMYCDHDTAEPVEYYAKLPEADEVSTAVVIDPMLATAGSACATVKLLKEKGFANIVLICIVSCPEGIARFGAEHPDVTVYTACVDKGLNEQKYIVPGLGDAGDRIFGTK